MKRLLLSVIVLALLGVAVSVYSLIYSYGDGGGFCSISETFDCDVVQGSSYARIFGIKVAHLGVIGYALVAVGAFLKRRDPTDQVLSWFLVLACSGGLLFSFYLTGIEAFVLGSWCILCLGSQAVMLALSLLVGTLFVHERSRL